MIQGVIFDMDGLMFDTERIWATLWRPALATLGLSYKEGLEHLLGAGTGKIRPALQGWPLAGCPRHHQGRQLRCAAALLRRGLPRHGHRGGAVPAGL